MNVEEVEYSVPTGDKMINILTHQKSLMDKYHHIEKNNGLLQTPDCPVDLNDKFGQSRLKDFAWRMSEEIGEALEALEIHPDQPKHYQEELSDALHFLAEFTILSGIGPDQVQNHFGSDYLDVLFANSQASIIVEERFDCLPKHLSTQSWKNVMYEYAGRLLCETGKTCNFLKNKPWKQSHIMTDTAAFHQALRQVWQAYADLLIIGKMSVEDITDLYFAKNAVNQFRQRSNY